MSAEQLIAMEAALAELSNLYGVARGFAALRTRAEEHLLPRLLQLGSRLRGLLRVGQLSEDEVERAAKELVALRSTWHSALEQLRSSRAYQEVRAAWVEDRQEDLVRLVPVVFAGLAAVSPAPTLYLPVSVSTGRRRPGFSPFLTAADCADRLVGLLRDGVEPDRSGSDWWDCDLPYLVCGDEPAALDTPISLRVAAPVVGLAVFASADEPTFRVFTPCLRAAMTVVLAAEATDEWWQAYDESYTAFREAVEKELAIRGVPVCA